MRAVKLGRPAPRSGTRVAGIRFFEVGIAGFPD